MGRKKKFTLQRAMCPPPHKEVDGKMIPMTEEEIRERDERFNREFPVTDEVKELLKSMQQGVIAS